MEFCWLSFTTISSMRSQIEGFFSLEELKDTTIGQAGVKVFERSFNISGCMKFLPNPRFFHVLLILIDCIWLVFDKSTRVS